MNCGIMTGSTGEQVSVRLASYSYVLDEHGMRDLHIACRALRKVVADVLIESCQPRRRTTSSSTL